MEKNHSKCTKFRASSKSPVGTVTKAILLPSVVALSIAKPPVGCSGARCDVFARAVVGACSGAYWPCESVHDL